MGKNVIKIRIRKDQKSLYEVKKLMRQDIKVHERYAKEIMESDKRDAESFNYHCEQVLQTKNALKILEEFEKRYELMRKLEDNGMLVRLEEKGIL